MPPGSVVTPADPTGFTLIGGPSYRDLRSDAERAALRDPDVRFDATLTFSDLGSMLILLHSRRRFSLLADEQIVAQD
ncbi:MAG: hypothetical protein QM604_11005 [Microbacterium sp.]